MQTGSVHWEKTHIRRSASGFCHRGQSLGSDTTGLRGQRRLLLFTTVKPP